MGTEINSIAIKKFPTCCRKLELNYIILRPLRISEDYQSYLLQK